MKDNYDPEAWKAWEKKMDLAELACKEALTELLAACEKDAGVPDSDDGDDEPVAMHWGEDGKAAGSAMTFGMLRRAREALNRYT